MCVLCVFCVFVNDFTHTHTHTHKVQDGGSISNGNNGLEEMVKMGVLGLQLLQRNSLKCNFHNIMHQSLIRVYLFENLSGKEIEAEGREFVGEIGETELSAGEVELQTTEEGNKEKGVRYDGGGGDGRPCTSLLDVRKLLFDAIHHTICCYGSFLTTTLTVMLLCVCVCVCLFVLYGRGGMEGGREGRRKKGGVQRKKKVKEERWLCVLLY